MLNLSQNNLQIWMFNDSRTMSVVAIRRLTNSSERFDKFSGVTSLALASPSTSLIEPRAASVRAVAAAPEGEGCDCRCGRPAIVDTLDDGGLTGFATKWPRKRAFSTSVSCCEDSPLASVCN